MRGAALPDVVHHAAHDVEAQKLRSSSRVLHVHAVMACESVGENGKVCACGARWGRVGACMLVNLPAGASHILTSVCGCIMSRGASHVCVIAGGPNEVQIAHL